VVLEGLPAIDDPRLLVGSGTFDDAGVVRLSDDVALVQSVDFFTPVVDDPFDFGRIAAANALSDIYAMGAEPLSALAVCAFPAGTLSLATLQRILAGGLDTLQRDGVLVVGGHTVKGPELNYGLAVTGTVHPDRVLTNAGARAGDLLLLTKPIGSGVLATALKNDNLPAEQEAPLVESMAATNRTAGRAAAAAGAHALTDITGYGLVGHGLELAAASGVTLEIDASRLPLLPGAHHAAATGKDFGGLKANRAWAEQRSNLSEVGEVTAKLLCDPQTSGGLLVALDPAAEERFVTACRDGGVTATAIGRAVDGDGTARIVGEALP
jgi:selenide,water dikinase